MAGSLKLVESYYDVLDNVLQFNFDLKFHTELQQKLSQFKSWYYVPEIDKFGPSIFVGYKDMNATDFEWAETWGNTKDGEATEHVLRKFFRPIQRSHPKRRRLESELFELCSRYGKRPNKSFRINIPRDYL